MPKAGVNSQYFMAKIYDSPNWGTVIVRIESDGLIYDGVGMFAKCIGRFDSKGYVYNGIGIFGKLVGRFDSDSKVYDDVGMFGSFIGRVESDGRVYSTGLTIHSPRAYIPRASLRDFAKLTWRKIQMAYVSGADS